MNCFTQKDVWEFPAKTSVREGLSTTLGISVLQHGCLAGHVLKELLALLDASHKSELLPSSLPVLAALHDVGKANPYFLKKLLRYCHDEGRWTEFADDAVPDVEETPHPVVSAAVLKALGAPVYCCQVVAEHHGHSFLRAIPSGNAEYLGGDPWARFRKTLADEIVKLVGLEGFPSRLKDRNRKDVQTALWLGWVILADWIASRRDAPVPAGEEARCASELVAQAGFRSYRLKNARTFEQIFGFSPRRAQSVLMEAYAGPGVYVLEAPTGCGKTEAALGLAFRALNAGDASGIYFALPTQLTSNRAHERVQKAVAMYLGESADVRLSHSGVHLQSVQMGKEAAPGGIWYTSSRLGLLAPFGVGTVDQALLAILSTKFSEVRLAGLYGKVVILDEIHSYDAYTLELIAILVKKLEALGAVVIILSATLAHSGLKKVLGVSELTESSEVVVLTAKTAEGVFQVQDDEADAHPVAVELLDDDHAEEKAFVKAVECAKAGMQVIWIENTVKAAQRIHARCVQKGITSGLLHSRFRAADRDSNETRWTELFGKSGTAQRAVEGRILVGTQVLEQSLDLDADFMVTRMAPLDLLVQRFGRLWRHGSTVRPDGCERAEAWVLAVPEISEESPVLDAGMQQPFGITGRIYHPYILMRTLETLKARLSAGGNVLNLPKEVRNLMKSVFVDRDELTEAGQEYKQHLLAQTKMLEDSAKGRQGSTHEQPEEVATRMVDLPSWETVVLDEEDFEALSVCASPEEAAVLLENCVVKSPSLLTPPGLEEILDKFPFKLRPWAKCAPRFKRLSVCRCLADGTLMKANGDPIGRSASYSKESGLLVN